MFSATTVAASVAALVLVATLVVPQGAGEPAPVPAAGGATLRVAADGGGDFQTISDAMAAAEDGDTVLVAPGTYTEHLLIDKDITLAGDGPREEIVVEFPQDGPAQYMGYDEDEGDQWLSFPVVLQGSDAVVRSLTIAVPLGGGGILVEGGAPEFADLSILPHPDAEIRADYSAAELMLPFEFMEGSSPIVRGSAWTGFLYGGESSPTFEGNTITASVMALDGPGEVVLRGNTFLDGALLHLEFDLSGTIEGNDLTSGAIGMDGGTWMVKDNVVRGPTHVSRGPVVSVTSPAISFGGASSADIVGNTVTGFETGIQVSDEAVATVEGNDLTGNDVGIAWDSTEDGGIEGNTVRGGIRGIEITAGDPSVVGNVVEDASRLGVFIGVGTGPTLDGNRVCGNGTNLIVADKAEPVMGENEICPDEVAEAE